MHDSAESFLLILFCGLPLLGFYWVLLARTQGMNPDGTEADPIFKSSEPNPVMLKEDKNIFVPGVGWCKPKKRRKQ